MNSKLTIIGLMISFLLAVSVSGQQITPLTPQQIILQDDPTSDHLIFTLATGEYEFESCRGHVSIKGIGKVSVTGCKVVLKDLSATRRVLAEVDLCARAGKADIALAVDRSSTPSDAPVIEFVISDAKTQDSVFACEPRLIDPK